jgi:hypothetical protein
MPRLVVSLSQEEFDRLRDRAVYDLRHPRDTARLLIRDALNGPSREPQEVTRAAERDREAVEPENQRVSA